MKLIFQNGPQQYRLLLDEAVGDYILDVLCGRVGMYGVQVKLTAEQVLAYQEQGSVALNILAEQIWQEEDRKLLERRRLQNGTDKQKHYWWQFWR